MSFNLAGFQPHHHRIAVPVNILAFALIAAQEMGSFKVLFYHYFVHVYFLFGSPQRINVLLSL